MVEISRRTFFKGFGAALGAAFVPRLAGTANAEPGKSGEGEPANPENTLRAFMADRLSGRTQPPVGQDPELKLNPNFHGLIRREVKYTSTEGVSVTAALNCTQDEKPLFMMLQVIEPVDGGVLEKMTDPNLELLFSTNFNPPPIAAEHPWGHFRSPNFKNNPPVAEKKWFGSDGSLESQAAIPVGGVTGSEQYSIWLFTTVAYPGSQQFEANTALVDTK